MSEALKAIEGEMSRWDEERKRAQEREVAYDVRAAESHAAYMAETALRQRGLEDDHERHAMALRDMESAIAERAAFTEYRTALLGQFERQSTALERIAAALEGKR